MCVHTPGTEKEGGREGGREGRAAQDQKGGSVAGGQATCRVPLLTLVHNGDFITTVLIQA